MMAETPGHVRIALSFELCYIMNTSLINMATTFKNKDGEECKIYQ